MGNFISKIWKKLTADKQKALVEDLHENEEKLNLSDATRQRIGTVLKMYEDKADDKTIADKMAEIMKNSAKARRRVSTVIKNDQQSRKSISLEENVILTKQAKGNFFGHDEITNEDEEGIDAFEQAINDKAAGLNLKGKATKAKDFFGAEENQIIEEYKKMRDKKLAEEAKKKNNNNNNNNQKARYTRFGDRFRLYGSRGGWDNYYNDAGYKRFAKSVQNERARNNGLVISNGGRAAAFTDYSNYYRDEGDFADEYNEYNDDMNEMDDDYYYHYRGFDDNYKASAKLAADDYYYNDGYYYNDAYGQLANYYEERVNQHRRDHGTHRRRHRYGRRGLTQYMDGGEVLGDSNGMDLDSSLILKAMLFIGFIGLIYLFKVIYRYKMRKSKLNEKYPAMTMQISHDGDGEDRV